MVRVSAAELHRHWSKVQDMAKAEPVTVTSKGRDSMVLLTVEEYQRLRHANRRVMTLSDFTDQDIAELERTRAPEEAAIFDREVED